MSFAAQSSQNKDSSTSEGALAEDCVHSSMSSPKPIRATVFLFESVHAHAFLWKGGVRVDAFFAER